MPAPTSASHGWWMRQPRSDQKRCEREDDLLERHRAISRAISRMTRGARRSRSRWAAMRSRWKDSRACARRAGLGAERVGRAAEEVGQHPARGGRQVGARGRPAVAADEAVGRAVVGEGALGRERPAAGGAAVERRVEPVQLQQPGLEVAPRQLRARALLGRLHDGQGQPVDLLLGLALRTRTRRGAPRSPRGRAPRRGCACPPGRPSAAAPPGRAGGAPLPAGRRA